MSTPLALGAIAALALASKFSKSSKGGSRALTIEQILAMGEKIKRREKHPARLAAQRQGENRRRLIRVLTEAANSELSKRSNPRRSGGQPRFKPVLERDVRDRLKRLSTEDLKDLELALQARKPRGR